MFFLKSSDKRLREDCANLLRMARKVVDYRRDVLKPETLEAISREGGVLAGLLAKADTPSSELSSAAADLQRALKPAGGRIYPVTFWSENIETLLVVAILIIGLRSFFLQPFKIPTNSMYPTYAGMTAQVYTEPDSGPSLPLRMFRLLTLGAVNHEVKSPYGGRVAVPLMVGETEMGRDAKLVHRAVRGRKWFGILPALKWEYVIGVGSQPVVIEVPADFSLDDVVLQTFFPCYDSLYQVFQDYSASNQVRETSLGPAILTDIELQPGDTLVNFDVQTGDMLFVDRVSYNFVRPRIGDPVVFPTQKIPGLRDSEGRPDEKYYIKRLVGTGGDELEIRDFSLLRNGEPITGSPVFDRNANRTDGYRGYLAIGRLAPGNVEQIPEGFVYTLGDNSPNSYDSRGWGLALQRRHPEIFTPEELEHINFVPETSVIGRAVFIFYPFSRRWGLVD